MSDRFFISTCAITLVFLACLAVVIAGGTGQDGGWQTSSGDYRPAYTLDAHRSHAADAYYLECGAIRERLTLDDLATRVREQGGFTYNPLYGATPKSGYAVSLQGYSRVFDNNEAVSVELRQYMLETWQEMADPARYAGGWADGGRLYLDVSIVLQDEREARKTGRANNQTAIYSLGTSESIYLQGPDGSWLIDAEGNWLPGTGYSGSQSTLEEPSQAGQGAA
ncbi:hypothetical protein [Methanocella arvoryzae]|uniref:Uncharacterized protein n=1 Tax=Methanocella arvoryzae (strain DSM 22066 / NBRC 105507 / MRE50) TaxID=351160 RepID=Q0W4Q1_METAR|nr:hypothetical protein [Methanocella arvoryzae]CAJ36642.1 hypothetical protein RCIX1357 [Methanocella arvoryzae MRE50]